MFNGGRQETLFTYLNATLTAGQSFQWGGDDAAPLIQLRVSGQASFFSSGDGAMLRLYRLGIASGVIRERPPVANNIHIDIDTVCPFCCRSMSILCQTAVRQSPYVDPRRWGPAHYHRPPH